MSPGNVGDHIKQAEEILDNVVETGKEPTAIEALAHAVIALVKVTVAANSRSAR